MLRCKYGRRRSRYRYLSRVSSAASFSGAASSWKGGVRASFRPSTSSARTSMSPVGSFGLRTDSSRASTRPRTAMTYSPRTSFARACASGASSASKTICVSPSRSRRSTNVKGPKSRRTATKPISTTSLPASDARNSPHECVRSNSPRWSRLIGMIPSDYLRLLHGIIQSFADARAGLPALERPLPAGLHIFQGDLAAGALVVADDDDEGHAERGGVLELLAELVRLRVHVHA